MEKREEVENSLRTKTLSHVKYAEKALALLETLSVAYSQVPSDVRESFIKIQNFFIEKELSAYRNLLLIVTIIGDEENKEATRMSLKRFLTNDMAIMHFWSHTGEMPGSWLSKDEQELRDLFKEIERELSGKRKYVKKKKVEVKPVEEIKIEPVKRNGKGVEVVVGGLVGKPSPIVKKGIRVKPVKEKNIAAPKKQARVKSKPPKNTKKGR